MPSTNRPPDMWSSVAIAFAVTIGSRCAARNTPVPSTSRSVTAAIIGPRTMDHLQGLLAAATVELDDATLDRIEPDLRGPVVEAIAAHELGHFELHKDESYLGLCTGEELVTDYEGAGTEAEANAFAAEFLMPAKLFQPRTQARQVTWDVPRRLSDEFQVTLSAAALRFAELSDERTAVVCSVDAKVKWTRRSRTFGKIIERGAKLDGYSLAIDAFAGKALPSRQELVEATAWKPDARDDEIVKEHSFFIPSLRAVMTLLWLPVS